MAERGEAYREYQRAYYQAHKEEGKNGIANITGKTKKIGGDIIESIT